MSKSRSKPTAGPADVLRRLLLAVALAVAVAGCSVETFTYAVDRYGTVTGRVVRLGCDDAYEVFDRPDAGTLLVSTNVLNETVVGCGDPDAVPKAERMRRSARLFLAETSDRPDCRIDRERAVTDALTEFYYRCPPPRIRPPVRR